jgi:hypothetical protein
MRFAGGAIKRGEAGPNGHPDQAAQGWHCPLSREYIVAAHELKAPGLSIAENCAEIERSRIRSLSEKLIRQKSIFSAETIITLTPAHDNFT